MTHFIKKGKDWIYRSPQNIDIPVKNNVAKAHLKLAEEQMALEIMRSVEEITGEN